MSLLENLKSLVKRCRCCLVDVLIPDDYLPNSKVCAQYREENESYKKAIEPINQKAKKYVEILRMNGCDIAWSNDKEMLSSGILEKIITDSLNLAQHSKASNARIKREFDEYRTMAEKESVEIRNEIERMVPDSLFYELLGKLKDEAVICADKRGIIVAKSKGFIDRGYVGSKLEHLFYDPQEYKRFQFNMGNERFDGEFLLASSKEKQKIICVPVYTLGEIKANILYFGEMPKEGFLTKIFSIISHGNRLKPGEGDCYDDMHLFVSG